VHPLPHPHRQEPTLTTPTEPLKDLRGAALVLDALAEKVEPLGGSLTSTDPDKLRGDLAAYGRKAQTKLSSAANAASRKQQAVTARSTQAAKRTATRVRSNPALPTVGVLAIGLLAAPKRSQAGQPQEQKPLQAPDSPQDMEPPSNSVPLGAQGAPEPDLENLSTANCVIEPQLPGSQRGQT